MITVGDLGFGNVLPGIASGRVLSICNDGDDTLTFGNPNRGTVIEWTGPPFNVSSVTLDWLRELRLPAGRCTTLIVSIVPSSAGYYRTVARIWSNAAGGRDTSVWTGTAVAHRPLIVGLDFGERRLSGRGECIRNADGGTTGLVRIANVGTAEFEVRSVAVTSEGGAFEIDTSHEFNLTRGVRVRPTVGTDTLWGEVAVRFSPHVEGPHTGSVIVTMVDGTSISAVLQGSGIESHVFIGDTLALPLASTRPGGFSRATAIIRSTGTSPLTITGLVVEGLDGEFTVKSHRPLPVRLAPGDFLGAEVEFTPSAAGQRSARLLVVGDHSRCDDSTMQLIGIGTEEADIEEDGDAPTDRHLLVIPNPAHERLVLRYEPWSRTWARVELVDLLGREVGRWDSSTFDGSMVLDLDGIPAGEYLLRLVTRHGVTASELRVSYP